MSTTGLFGKLPSYGDFLSRDLDSGFVEVWDEWLQGFVQGTQEQLGEAWLDVYLTSPIWRFAFSSGVVDDSTWVGLLLPSVDRVGRYFPFSLARNIGACAPTVALSSASTWFDELEELALQALEGEISVDDILDAVNAVAFQADERYQTNPAAFGASMNAVISLESDTQNMQTVYPQLLHQVLQQQLQSYSVWSTRGSQLVEPCMFYTRGLPTIGNAAALLDGNWDASNWDQPFALIAGMTMHPADDFANSEVDTHEQ